MRPPPPHSAHEWGTGVLHAHFYGHLNVNRILNSGKSHKFDVAQVHKLRDDLNVGEYTLNVLRRHDIGAIRHP
jgi:hypothetical protein